MGFCDPKIGEGMVNPSQPENPIGPCGMDRSLDPSCVQKFVMHPCAFYSYEGTSLLFIISVVCCVFGVVPGWFWMGLFTFLFWKPVKFGVDYSVDESKPIMVGQAIEPTVVVGVYGGTTTGAVVQAAVATEKEMNKQQTEENIVDETVYKTEDTVEKV